MFYYFHLLPQIFSRLRIRIFCVGNTSREHSAEHLGVELRLLWKSLEKIYSLMRIKCGFFYLLFKKTHNSFLCPLDLLALVLIQEGFQRWACIASENTAPQRCPVSRCCYSKLADDDCYWIFAKGFSNHLMMKNRDMLQFEAWLYFNWNRDWILFCAVSDTGRSWNIIE